MYWSQTERESWSLDFMFNQAGHPRTCTTSSTLFHANCTSTATLGASRRRPSSHAELGSSASHAASSRGARAPLAPRLTTTSGGRMAFGYNGRSATTHPHATKCCRKCVCPRTSGIQAAHSRGQSISACSCMRAPHVSSLSQHRTRAPTPINTCCRS